MPDRIAIVGCGGIAHNHAPHWQSAGAEIACAVDAEPARAEVFAKRFSIPHVFTDWQQAYASGYADIADICLPHALHAPAAVAAAEAGLHVFVEKPMATTLAEADAMVEACQRAGRVIAVRHNQRFSGDRRRIKQLVESGALGDLYLCRSWWVQGPGYITARPWYGHRNQGHGGVVLGLGIHHLDLLRWIAGEVERVAAYGMNRVIGGKGMDAEDTAVLLFRFRSGALGDMMMTNGDATNRYAPDAEGLEFHGTKGWVSTRGGLHGVMPAVLGDGDVHPVPTAPVQENEFEMMLRCVRTGEEPLTHGGDIRATVELAVAAYAAMDKDASVALPLIERPRP